MKFHPTNRPAEWGIIDREFVWVIEAAAWCVVTRDVDYVAGKWEGKMQLLHRVIAALAGHAWLKIDHKNHDGLDNRLCNLRAATDSQNGANRGKTKLNTSGYKGVCWDVSRRRWLASITVRGRAVHLGRFDGKIAAAVAYDAAAVEYFGEFAHLNFPQPLESNT